MVWEKLKELAESMSPRREIDPARFEHPLAAQTDWTPLRPGGSNFKTQALRESQQEIRILASRGAKLFYGLFASVGLLVGLAPWLAAESEFEEGRGLIVAFGAVFFLVGALGMALGGKPRVFSRPHAAYWRGWRPPPPASRTPFSRIGGIQLLGEHVSSSDGSYVSYEINLVLDDASRVNVLDHGAEDVSRRQAARIAEFLEVPLWDASDAR